MTRIESVTLLIMLTALATDAKIFRFSVCNRTILKLDRPTMNNRYLIESPGYDGHTPYDPNVDCLHKFYVNITTKYLCCRLFTVDFDLRVHDVLSVDSCETPEADSALQPYFLYNQSNVKHVVLTLTPQLKYAFHFTTKKTAQNGGTGFRLQINCTKCVDDKLEGQTMCDKDGDTHTTYTIDKPFAYREERYIQNYNFRNFTVPDSPSFGHDLNCTLILGIQAGICCNMVCVWQGAGILSNDELFMYTGIGDLSSADHDEWQPVAWDWSEQRILAYSVDGNNILYANKKYKLELRTDYNQKFARSGFQLRLMCIWCDASKGPPSPPGTTSRTMTQTGTAPKDNGEKVMETVLICLAGVLSSLLLLVLIVYCWVTKTRQMKEAEKHAKAGRSVTAKDIKTEDAGTIINTVDQPPTSDERPGEIGCQTKE